MSQNSIWNPDLQSLGDNHTAGGWILWVTEAPEHRAWWYWTIKLNGTLISADEQHVTIALIWKRLQLSVVCTGHAAIPERIGEQGWAPQVTHPLPKPWNSSASDKLHNLSISSDSSFSTDRLILFPRQRRISNATHGQVEPQGSNFLVRRSHPAKFVREILWLGRKSPVEIWNKCLRPFFPAAWTKTAIMPLSLKQLYIPANHTTQCLPARLGKTNI